MSDGTKAGFTLLGYLQDEKKSASPEKLLFATECVEGLSRSVMSDLAVVFGFTLFSSCARVSANNGIHINTKTLSGGFSRSTCQQLFRFGSFQGHTVSTQLRPRFQ